MNKYKIIVRGKIFAKNLSLTQCMKLSVYLGKRGISHREILDKGANQ